MDVRLSLHDLIMLCRKSKQLKTFMDKAGDQDLCCEGATVNDDESIRISLSMKMTLKDLNNPLFKTIKELL